MVGGMMKKIIENIEAGIKSGLEKAKRMGMYGDTDSVTIGKFTISRQDPDGEDRSVWIQHESGEGGEFQDSAFEKAIEEFYKANF